jgi:hypothetical protein
VDVGCFGSVELIGAVIFVVDDVVLFVVGAVSGFVAGIAPAISVGFITAVEGDSAGFNTVVATGADPAALPVLAADVIGLILTFILFTVPSGCFMATILYPSSSFLGAADGLEMILLFEASVTVADAGSALVVGVGGS